MANYVLKTQGGYIRVEVNDIGVGEIETSLKEKCHYCEREYCGDHGDFCFPMSEKFDIEGVDLENVASRIRWNRAIDAIESMILSHACAGIDVESEAYVNGINDALNAIANYTN